ncbi:MAG: hypothetical protein K0U82_12865, partial [Planctomycetes bacterium]|nr:hypothetical protein [Planctomycetota bacterium]
CNALVAFQQKKPAMIFAGFFYFIRLISISGCDPFLICEQLSRTRPISLEHHPYYYTSIERLGRRFHKLDTG